MTRIQLWARLSRDHCIVSRDLEVSIILARGQQFGRANFGSARAHARSIAAKVLVDGANPFTFLFAL